MKATAKFVTPKVEREVVVSMTETQAHKLRTILGNSNCAEHGFTDIYEALKDLFPEPLPAYEYQWAIRNSVGRICK